MENKRILISSLLINWLLLCVCWLSAPAQIQFSEIAAQAGMDDLGSNHGVSLVDYDGDGWEDIYLACRQPPNRLFRNQGNGTFRDVAQELGLAIQADTRLALWGDINNDGLIDLFLGTEKEGDFLFLHQPDHTFKDISEEAGMIKHTGGATLGAMMGDVDNDGWLDIYCARHYAQNTLYRNKGDLTFEDLTYLSGATDESAAMGALFFDYDNDSDLDIYLVHDAKFANKLYQNNGRGRFREVAKAAGVDMAAFGMGVDVADINQDGWLDMYISNFFANTLYLNQGDGTFRDITHEAGVDDIGMGWGVSFLDVDNDGWQDIYVNNSAVAGNRFPNYPNVLYHNQGDLTFKRISDQTILASLGNGYGLASGDLNQDGRVDLVIANNLGEVPIELFENQTLTLNHWLTIELAERLENRSIIGTRLKLKANGSWQTDEVSAGGGWASQQSHRLHFGLGKAARVDSLILIWPGGNTNVYTDIGVDRLLRIKEQSPLSLGATRTISPNPLSSTQWLVISPTHPDEPLRIWDLTGKEIQPRARTYDRFTQQTRLNLAGLAPGIYALCLTDRIHKVWVR